MKKIERTIKKNRGCLAAIETITVESEITTLHTLPAKDSAVTNATNCKIITGMKAKSRGKNDQVSANVTSQAKFGL